VLVPRTPLKKVHLLGCARSRPAKELFKPFNTFREFKNVKKHEYAPTKTLDE